MKRTGINIPERTHKALKKIASREKSSISEVIKEAVSVFLREEKTKDTVYQKGSIFDRLPIVNNRKESLSDLSENHDKYLGEEHTKD